MTSEPNLFKALTSRQHWQYETFAARFEDAAQALALDEHSPRLASYSVSRRTFDRWLAGDIDRLPRPDACRILERLFDVPASALFAFATPSAQDSSPGPTTTTPGAQGAWGTSEAATEEFLKAIEAALGQGLRSFLQPRASDVDRRLFLQIWSALSATVALPLGTIERVAASLAGASRIVDDHVVEALESVTTALGQRYFTTGPQDLIGPVRTHLNGLTGRLHQPMGERHRQQLNSVTGGTAAMAGWLSYVLDRPGDARAYFTLARDVAQQADDAALLAHALGGLSLLYSSVPRGGDGGDTATALELAIEGERVAQRAPALTRSWLAARVAAEHAAGGDARSSDRAMGQARDHLEQASGLEPVGTFNYGDFFGWNAGHLDGYRGSCEVLLGRPKQAADVLSGLLMTTSPTMVRRLSAIRTDLAVASLQLGDVDAACDQAVEALGVAADTGYTLGLARLQGLRTKLGPWRTHSGVRELEDRLATS
jgi:hypothetical protein